MAKSPKITNDKLFMAKIIGGDFFTLRRDAEGVIVNEQKIRV
jgi:hypothetical protein